MVTTVRWGGGRVRGGVVAVNAVGAAAAAVFAAVGVVRPDFARPGSTPGALTGFWAASSAVRTWAVTVPLLVGIVRDGRPARPLLVVAGLVQLGDAALGVEQHNPRMTVLPAAMGLVHLVSTCLFTS